MSRELVKLHQATLKKREELMEATFYRPPPDWAGFQKAVGRWLELTSLKEEIESLLKADDQN